MTSWTASRKPPNVDQRTAAKLNALKVIRGLLTNQQSAAEVLEGP